MADTDSVNLALGTGRRKTAVARVFLRKPVTAGATEADLQRAAAGQITVNGKPLADYFRSEELVQRVTSPLDVTDNLGKHSIMINVTGGGPTGQADASRHGLARALDAYDATNHETLRANGFLTRDRRMVERKKFGRPKARKRFQFSKR